MLLGSTEGFVSKGGTSPLWGSRLLRVADKSARIIRCRNLSVSRSLSIFSCTSRTPLRGWVFSATANYSRGRRAASEVIFEVNLDFRARERGDLRRLRGDNFFVYSTEHASFLFYFCLFIIVISRLRELKQIYDFSKAHERL